MPDALPSHQDMIYMNTDSGRNRWYCRGVHSGTLGQHLRLGARYVTSLPW